MMWSNVITGSDIFIKSEINTGNLPCFGLYLFMVFNVCFTTSLYHKRHITVTTFGYVPSYFRGCFFTALFVLNAFLNRIESALFNPADLSLRYSDFCRGFHLGFAAEKPQR